MCGCMRSRSTSAQVEGLERSDPRPARRRLAPKPPPGFHCPPAGGACRGPLPVGTHTSRIFSPRPSPTPFRRAGRTRRTCSATSCSVPIGDPRSASGSTATSAAPEEGLRTSGRIRRSAVRSMSLDAMAYVSPRSRDDDTRPVEVGGLEGVSLDIAMSPSWTMCSFSGSCRPCRSSSAATRRA